MDLRVEFRVAFGVRFLWMFSSGGAFLVGTQPTGLRLLVVVVDCGGCRLRFRAVTEECSSTGVA